MNEQQIYAYKMLAANVLGNALQDLKSKERGAKAHEFLTAPYRARDRALWLAWLDMDDAGFQKLLFSEKFQGNRSKIFDKLKR